MKRILLISVVLAAMLLSACGTPAVTEQPEEQVLRLDQTSKEWPESDVESLIHFMNSLYRDKDSTLPSIPEYEWYSFDSLSGWQKISQAKIMVSNVWCDIHTGQMEVLKAKGIDYDKEEPYSSLWMAWFNADLAIWNASSYNDFFEAHKALYDALHEMHKVIQEAPGRLSDYTIPRFKSWKRGIV